MVLLRILNIYKNPDQYNIISNECLHWFKRSCAANVFVISKIAFITLVLFVVLIMALILGHSQVRYIHEYLVSDKIVTLCYPDYQICDFLDMKVVREMVPSFSVST